MVKDTQEKILENLGLKSVVNHLRISSQTQDVTVWSFFDITASGPKFGVELWQNVILLLIEIKGSSNQDRIKKYKKTFKITWTRYFFAWSWLNAFTDTFKSTMSRWRIITLSVPLLSSITARDWTLTKIGPIRITTIYYL